MTAGDQTLRAALSTAGSVACAAVWSSDVDWSQFEAVVIRSCWDYHLRAGEFLRWIERIERAGIPVINSPALIRWNADKRYLRELEEEGVTIPATLWLEPGEEVELAEICRTRNWESAVIKPLISASAYRTERTKDGVVRGPLMIQDFVPAIEREGEWSLLYFAGEFSHAVRKRPGAGDFRVQKEFGGTAVLEDPPSEVLRVAERTMEAVSERPVFARVDLVQDRAVVYLMEIELIEPELFLQLAAGAAERLAAAIQSALQGT